MAKANTTLKIESDIKEKAAAIYKELGFSLSDAVELFFRQTIAHSGFPFALKTVKKEEKQKRAAPKRAETVKKTPSKKPAAAHSAKSREKVKKPAAPKKDAEKPLTDDIFKGIAGLMDMLKK